MRRSNNRTRGFTMIELLFAMSFVSVILIVILTATLSIVRIYNKGITLKQVNTAGAVLAGDLQSGLKVANAPLSLTSIQNGAHTGGRLCLGTYSYVWNLKGSNANKYAGSSEPIGIVKVSDTTREMCAGTPDVRRDRATELLTGANTNGVGLQLRSLDVTQVATNGSGYVYTVLYVISTNDQTLIQATGDGDSCKGGASDEFCALNAFSFSTYVRQGGSGRI